MTTSPQQFAAGDVRVGVLSTITPEEAQLRYRMGDGWKDLAALALIASALVLCPLAGHVDDIDAQVYQVVASHMAQSGDWVDARFLPDYWPHFREHLPFGFWPAAAAIRVLGEKAGWIPYGIASLSTVGLLWWWGRRMGGQSAGLMSALVLATTEVFWQYGARILLEPLLLLFSTVGAIFALLEEPDMKAGAVAAAATALAVLVKGPFGLVPFAAAALSSLIVERSARRLAWSCAVGVLALAPVALFLLLDRSWYRGYFLAQVAASAQGTRRDGVFLWSFPVRVVMNRFWPALAALPLAGAVLWKGEDDDRHILGRLSLACCAAVGLLCLPARKWGNHTDVALPLFALWAGAAFARAAAVFGWRRRPWVGGWLWASAVGLAIASTCGAGRLVLRPPCVISSTFRAPLELLPAGSRVAVVDGEGAFAVLCELAAETRLVPALVPRASAAVSSGASALILPSAASEKVAGFATVADGRGFRLMMRDDASRRGTSTPPGGG